MIGLRLDLGISAGYLEPKESAKQWASVLATRELGHRRLIPPVTSERKLSINPSAEVDLQQAAKRCLWQQGKRD